MFQQIMQQLTQQQSAPGAGFPVVASSRPGMIRIGLGPWPTLRDLHVRPPTKLTIIFC
jgi:hypothetical protein